MSESTRESDYLARTGAELIEDGTATCVRSAGRDVLFAEIAPEALREVINRAMENAVPYYRRNVAASGVTMEPARVEEASLQVVLNTLFVYNLWRQNYPDRKDQPLVVGPAELAHVQSQDACLTYCQGTYGTEYAKYAAALIGMTAEEFEGYEAGRNAFWDR
jgi:hypothetical protein